MKTVLSFDEIEYFTSYEALMFLDLAKDPSLSGGLPNFFQVILGDIQKPVKSNLLDPIFHLRQGNGLIKRIQSSPFSEEEIINNIRKHLRNQASCDYLFEEMSGVIARGCMSKKDTEDFQEDSLNQIDDFATLLYKALIFSLEKQASDHKALKHLYDVRFEANSNKAKPNYSYDTFFKKLNEIDGLDGLKKQEIELIMKVLKKVSQTIANDVFSQKERYCFDKINERLLTKGTEEFTTFGSSDEGSLPMSQFFLSKDHLFIVGDGGIGKTSFLVNELKKTNTDKNLIPIFISLANLKYNSIQRANHFIRSFILDAIKEEIPSTSIFGTEPAEYYLNKALTLSDDNRKIILFLDGFNEISNMAGSALKSEIRKEINELTRYANVRIILTSRSFFDDKASFPSLRYIQATGIDTKTMEEFLLKESGAIPVSKKLLEILHNPLFLLMYASNEIKSETKGGILFEYCNGIKSSYNEIRLMSDPVFVKEELPTYMPLLLGFILPAVAAYMEKNDIRYITKEDLDEIIASSKELTDPFKKTSNSYFKRYSVGNALSALTRDLISAGSVVQKILSDRLTFLQKDNDDNFTFSHQFYQDYFASLFRIYSFMQVLSDDSPYFQYARSQMDTETFSLTKEIADQSSLIDLSALTKILNTTNINEGFYARNLLMMLSTFNQGTLASLTFKNFDFSNVTMTSYKFSTDDESASFINCNFSETSFLAYDDSIKVIRKITTYNNRPALCELIINDSTPNIRYIDLKTENELYSKSWDFYYSESYSDFECMNDIVLSENKQYIILYDHNYQFDFFFVFSEKNNSITKHYFELQDQKIFFSFYEEDKLVVMYESKNGNIYNLSYAEPDLETDDIDKLYREAPMLFEYRGILDSIDIPISVLPIYKDLIYDSFNCRFELSDIYTYKNNLISFFHTSNLWDTLLVSDIETCVPYPTKIFSAPMCGNGMKPFTYMDNDHIYFTFANTIFDMDLENLEVHKLFDIPDNNFVVCMKKTKNILSVATTISYFDFDLVEKTCIEKHSYHIPHATNSYACCDNYMVVGRADHSLCTTTIYRLDNHEVSTQSYGNRISIHRVQYVSNNRALIIYSSGYIALINTDTLKLINTYTLPDEYTFYDMDYNKEKEHLAISICNKNLRYERPTSLLIVNINDMQEMKIKHTFNNQYYECKLCYSLDGNYLFEDNMGTLLIYETDSYNVIHELEVGFEFLFMKAYSHYMCAIVGSDGSELLSVNIDALNMGVLSYNYSDIRDLEPEELKEALFMHEVCPFYYEVVYENTINNDYEIEPWLRFFYYNSGDAPSDYYQDGILVRCKDEYSASADIPTYKLSFMTPTFGHIDKASHTYFGMTIDHRFAKINLSTRAGEAIDIVPNLYIKDCHFYFDKRPVELICGIIEDNLGIIEKI